MSAPGREGAFGGPRGRKLTEELSDSDRTRLAPEFLDNEETYWRLRDRLREHHRGKWVAVHQGRLVAESDGVFEVLDKVNELGAHAYVACVGEEERPFVVRATFSYDVAYRPFALPRVAARFAGGRAEASVIFDDVGRDVLNQLRVTFDGPAGRVDVEEAS